MLKTLKITTAVSIALAAATLSSPASAKTPVTSASLMTYCQAEKERRGYSSARVQKIVVAVDDWGQPDLRCLVSAPEIRSWMTALPSSVCQEVAGNSRWFMRAYRVYCGVPEAAGQAVSMPHLPEPIAIPDRNRM